MNITEIKEVVNMVNGLNQYEIADVIEKELEKYIKENPYNDTYEIATHFFFFGLKYTRQILEKTLGIMKNTD